MLCTAIKTVKHYTQQPKDFHYHAPPKTDKIQSKANPSPFSKMANFKTLPAIFS